MCVCVCWLVCKSSCGSPCLEWRALCIIVLLYGFWKDSAGYLYFGFFLLDGIFPLAGLFPDLRSEIWDLGRGGGRFSCGQRRNAAADNGPAAKDKEKEGHRPARRRQTFAATGAARSFSADGRQEPGRILGSCTHWRETMLCAPCLPREGPVRPAAEESQYRFFLGPVSEWEEEGVAKSWNAATRRPTVNHSNDNGSCRNLEAFEYVVIPKLGSFENRTCNGLSDNCPPLVTCFLWDAMSAIVLQCISSLKENTKSIHYMYVIIVIVIVIIIAIVMKQTRHTVRMVATVSQHVNATYFSLSRLLKDGLDPNSAFQIHDCSSMDDSLKRITIEYLVLTSSFQLNSI